MIETFWSMCRACPSVPVDKLHSEYRSTYQWHEYTGPRQEVVRRPPQNSFAGQVQEPALPRRKKHPELAYRTHKILTGTEALLDKSFFYDRARSEERWAASQEKNSRRSKSEGPPAGKPSYKLIYTKPIYSFIPNRSYNDRKAFSNNENEAPKNFSGQTNRGSTIQTEPLRGDSKKEASQSRILCPRTAHILQTNTDSPDQPKKSISMNVIKNRESDAQETVPVHRRTAGLKNKSEAEVLQSSRTGAGNDSSNVVEDPTHRCDDTDGEFKSEYRKNFQPFNTYDYDESKGIFEKRTAPLNSLSNQTEVESPSSSWYKEVVLLRQKANQYRHRGWGTELVPDHIAQVYNDQIMLWEQVSRRSTLSALSLASSVLSRDGSPSKEEKENRKNSPMKSLTRARSAKVATATHQGKSPKAPAAKAHSATSPKKGNYQVKKLGIKRTSPDRTSRESAVGTPPTIQRGLNQGMEKSKRRPRPIELQSKQLDIELAEHGRRTERKAKETSAVIDTSLVATVPCDSKTTQQKKKDKIDDKVEDFPPVDQEQIVKSPPEPTRVKSPEQIVMRSPEPVNWTVPLDTGKTFTVTQNIREGEPGARSCSEAKPGTLGSLTAPTASVSAPTELKIAQN